MQGLTVIPNIDGLLVTISPRKAGLRYSTSAT